MKQEKTKKDLNFEVKLQNANMVAKFEIVDKEKFLESWRKRELAEFVKSNGDIFSYELSKFYFMEIQKLKWDEKTK